MEKKTYLLIGHPVKHSLSPAMQNAAFRELAIDAEYGLRDVEPGQLAEFLKDAHRENLSGFNVTIPHKISVKEYIEKNGTLDENAKRLGAVNTVKVTEEGALRGFNTDGPGFYRSLIEGLKFEPEGKTVFTLGAGGAARAVVMYLGSGPKKIFISDIDKEKAADLKSHYQRYYDEGRIAIVNEDKMAESMAQSDLLINATPVGMKEGDGVPFDKGLLHPGLYVYDLVYNRPYTELVREATKRKLHAVTGLGMLLYQGAIAFEIWTGLKAPVAVMRRALKETLKGVSE